MGEMSKYHFQLEPEIKPRVYLWQSSARRAGRFRVW